jgi:beta-carotene hydroxylase
VANVPRQRRAVALEASAHVILVVVAIAALRWTPVIAVYVALVLFGDSVFPALSENFLHDQSAREPQHRTRTIRGRLFEWYFLELGFHLEHHLYPSVPTRNCREVSRRLTPHLSRLRVQPLKLI